MKITVTDDHLNAIRLLDSQGFPNPTPKILSGWGGMPSEKRCREILGDLSKLGFAEPIADNRYKATDHGRQLVSGKLF